MKILVLIKQVPNVEDIIINADTFTVDRSNAVDVLNPVDSHAVEAALSIRKDGDSVTILSMGPDSCEGIIREGIGMGADEGIRITDDKLKGADTLVTATTLSKAISHLGGYDYIFCGDVSADGGTAQIPSKLGTMLGYSLLSRASKIEMTEDGLKIMRKARTGFESLQGKCPLICSVTEDANEPRSITMKNRMKAKKVEVSVLSADEIGLSEEDLHSPSSVIALFPPKKAAPGQIIDGANAAEKTSALFEILKANHCL